MNQFKLTDYLDEVKAISSHNNIDDEAAVAALVTNLTTMREHNVGTGTLNYHTLGQAWNKLKYTEKINQRKELLDAATSTRITARRNGGTQ